MVTTLEKFIGASLKGSTRIAWFGLAADPPTLAHRAIVDAVLGSGLAQKIVVFPAGKLPYKDFTASDWQRTEMIELWKASAEFGDEVVISRFDLLRKQAITWYDLWNKLQELTPQFTHFLVVGSDQYTEIPLSWHKGRELMKQASFIILPRKGFPSTTPYNDRHTLLPIEPLEISSTSARTGDLSVVDEKVKASILEQRLYGQ